MEMPRIGKGQHRNRRNRPTHSVRFRILSFLFEYKNQVKQGQPWPVAFFIRTNLFSQRQNWTAETRGARAESDISAPLGSSPRPDLFQGELDACCESGWVERITDKASKRTRYRKPLPCASRKRSRCSASLPSPLMAIRAGKSASSASRTVIEGKFADTIDPPHADSPLVCV